MLNRLRNRLGSALERTGSLFAATGLSPNFWTILGLVLAFAAAVSYGTEYWFAPIVGGVLLLISGFFDIVDGQVARVTKKSTRRGSFLDSMFDKIAEVAIFAGILVGGYAEPYLVLLAISLSLLVSYARSKSEALGIRLQGVGIGERAERLLIIAIVGMIPGLMQEAVILVIIVAGITLVQRIRFVTKNTG